MDEFDALVADIEIDIPDDEIDLTSLTLSGLCDAYLLIREKVLGLQVRGAWEETDPEVRSLDAQHQACRYLLFRRFRRLD